MFVDSVMMDLSKSCNCWMRREEQGYATGLKGESALRGQGEKVEKCQNETKIHVPAVMISTLEGVTFNIIKSDSRIRCTRDMDGSGPLLFLFYFMGQPPSTTYLTSWS